MMTLEYKETTPLPNVIVDRHLKLLTFSELKILLVIIRQTYGWVDRQTGKRKVRDRITHQQFKEKTGLSKRTITRNLKKLVSRNLISVGDQNGRMLFLAEERRGKAFLYYGYGQRQRRNGVSTVGEILSN